jgi:hypothetical protein
MDITALARQVMEEEGITVEEAEKRLPRPTKEPVLTSRKARNIALGVRALDMRVKQGLTWQQIADELGFRSASTIYEYAQRARARLDVETKDDKRFVQRQRLDSMYGVLQDRIAKGGKGVERSVEVAVKVLEREARLEGLDLDGLSQENTHQAIIINVQPHPDDEAARKLVSKHQPKVLPPPSTGILFDEEIHTADWRDGSGEDVVRPVLDSETTEGAE